MRVAVANAAVVPIFVSLAGPVLLTAKAGGFSACEEYLSAGATTNWGMHGAEIAAVRSWAKGLRDWFNEKIRKEKRTAER